MITISRVWSVAWVVYHEQMCGSVAIVQTHGGPCPLLPAGQSDGPFKCQSDSGAWTHFIKAVRLSTFTFFTFIFSYFSSLRHVEILILEFQESMIIISKNPYKVKKGVEEWILKTKYCLCPKLTMSILCFLQYGWMGSGSENRLVTKVCNALVSTHAH